METNDHKDNRDCFIEEDGAFDEMGLNCGVCVGTALEVKAMKANNASLDEMKKAIDDKYLS